MLKIKRKRKFINEYDKSKGHIKKEVILIILTLYNIQIKVLKRFKIQYNGDLVEINRKYKIIN